MRFSNVLEVIEKYVFSCLGEVSTEDGKAIQDQQSIEKLKLPKQIQNNINLEL